eukprot:scaffold21983_cov118-Isochrysis_galbana.AAC.1
MWKLRYRLVATPPPTSITHPTRRKRKSTRLENLAGFLESKPRMSSVAKTGALPAPACMSLPAKPNEAVRRATGKRARTRGAARALAAPSSGA